MWLPRGLAASAVAGLLIGAPVVGPPGGGAAHPVPGASHRVLLADASTVAAPAAAAPAGAGTTVKDAAVGSGSLIGVAFSGAGAPAAPRAVRVRVQNDDHTWQSWQSLNVGVDGAPDPQTPEGRRAAVASEPLWIGAGSGDRHVQVQLPASAAAAATLAVVDPGRSSADAALATAPPAASAQAAASAPAIHPRADWGADESLRNCPAQYASTVVAAVLHHTDGTNDYSQADVPSIIRGIYRYHTATLGWCDIGYNALVDRFGGVWEGRAGGLDRPVIGAHAGGFNDTTFGVAMLGSYTAVEPSAATLESVAQVVAWKLGTYGRDPAGTTQLTSAGGTYTAYPAGAVVTTPVIMGHRDVDQTDCPGDRAYADLPAVRTRVARLMAEAGTTSAIAQAWAASGGASGPLGDPVGAESASPDGVGRFAHFSAGSIYWSPATGAHVVSGASYDKWASLGWERSPLGYPTSDTSPAPGATGSFTHFQGGSIYASAATGAHTVTGASYRAWADQGWERGPLGYPTTDTTTAPPAARAPGATAAAVASAGSGGAAPGAVGATSQHFAAGALYTSPATSGHPARAFTTAAPWRPAGSPFAFASRSAGPDRVQTAVAASAALYPRGGSADVVLVARTATVDGLSASYLAGLHNAPILYTDAHALPPATAAEITRLGARRLWLVGGTSVIGADLQGSLGAQHLTVQRVSGADRYGTAAAVAAAGPAHPARVFITSGTALADAAVAGPLAWADNDPILLTDARALPAATGAALATLGGARRTVVGGTGVVPADVYQAAGADQRLGGADRQATAVAVAEDAAASAGFTAANVALVGGGDQNAVDALSASPLAGATGTPLLYVQDPGSVGAATAAYLSAHRGDLGAEGFVLVVGGPSAVAEGAITQAAAAAQ